MSDKKKAKYFCENCGSEVGANARFCPKCGKFFSSVRCPKCGKLGTVKDFKNGCPQCHYAMTDAELYGTDDSDSSSGKTGKDGLKHKLSRKSKKNIKKAFSSFNEKNGGTFEQKKRTSATSDAPAWVFVVVIILLIILGSLLFIRCH